MSDLDVRFFEASHRSNNFDALRFFAAMLVLAQHSFRYYDLVQPTFFPYTYGIGDLGVSIFFFLSGFLVTASWKKRPKPLIFIQHRALRLYPALLCNIAFTIAVIGPLATSLPLADYYATIFDHLPEYAWGAVRMQIGPLPGCFQEPPFTETNASLWTLPVEAALYVGVLLAGLAGMLRRPYIVLFALPFYYGWLTALATTAPERVALLVHLLCFITGSLMFVMRGWQPGRGVIVLLGVLVLVALLANQMLRVIPIMLSLHALCFVAALAYVTRYAALSPRVSLKHFGRYGDFSYGIYLYGWPVQQVLFYRLRELDFVSFYLLSFVITLMLAVISWHGVEKWALRRRSLH